MKIIIVLLLLSCSTKQVYQTTRNTSSVKYFNLKDQSGQYVIKRETKLNNSKLITRSTIYSVGKKNDVLEKSISVSKIGIDKRTKSKALLPEASQFEVWLEKKEYSAKYVIDKKNKRIHGKINRPKISKEKSNVSYKLPSGRYFCFYSQLPECMIEQNLLLKVRNAKVSIFIIWDSYPFNLELYENLQDNIITNGVLSFAKKEKNSLAFELDLGNQIILFHFDRQLQFEKMFWIVQGISIERAEVTK